MVLGVAPLLGDTVSQGALVNAAVKVTAVTGLLLMENVCWTGGPPTSPFRKMVKELTLSVFCARKDPAVLESNKARAGTKE